MATREDRIYDFLNGLDTEIDVVDLVDIDSIDENNPFDSILSMIEEGYGFDVEIIYYHRALEYLAKNDPSLELSLDIASEMGYTTYNLNSELLASMLASQNARSEFYDLEDEINSFFDDLEDDEEDEEDDDDDVEGTIE